MQYDDIVIEHFLTDVTGQHCGDFTFNEDDLKLYLCKEIDLNDQPSQVVLSHPKIPGLSWMFFFYQIGPRQFQPKIAFDFPSYLRADTEVCVRLAGMHWIVKHKFEGSAWLSNCLPPQNMNERWTTMGSVKTVEIRINMSKVWFKFPMFTACCHPMNTKQNIRQPDFTNPDFFTDVQLIPKDPGRGRRLFSHIQVLAMHSPWFSERFRTQEKLNNNTIGPIINVPYPYEDMLNFLKLIYPNTTLAISEENVEGLMDIAREYMVPNVIRSCEKFLYKNLEGGSPVVSYHLARRHDLAKLQEASLLHLSEFNATQLRSRINMDMKGKPADAQELLFNDLCERLSSNTHP